MTPRKKRQEGDSTLETLRLTKTELSQDELAFKCGIPRSTYQRWISGQTEAKLTLVQLKALCKELKIEKIEDLPDNLGPPK
ncbi:helix-turn-helix transcriptional regulator [Microcoleus sp. C2C3]|jgi:transcriptional regulator with XRE-family HTH domain|uniref:helix-turn-helix transcriptional regulator n=1 Tax=unclassified Microcoleus TaxID=2642155 RepID=UPI002FD0F806